MRSLKKFLLNYKMILVLLAWLPKWVNPPGIQNSESSQFTVFRTENYRVFFFCTIRTFEENACFSELSNVIWVIV